MLMVKIRIWPLDSFFHMKKGWLKKLLLLANLLLTSSGLASILTGSWQMSKAGPAFTNNLSVNGYYNNGRFLIDLTPIKTEDNIAESVGWDGNGLYLIQRFPESPSGKERNKALGYIEPSVFSRYATPALTSVLAAFADSNELSRLESGNEVVILDTWRKYPEESNTYTARYLPAGGIEITASSPGQRIEPTGRLAPIVGFENGFTRWTYKSVLNQSAGQHDERTLQTEYNRYDPEQGKLIKMRDVKSDILFSPDGKSITDFRPKIPENRLTVWDYSQRQMLFEFYKQGMSDQNHIYTLIGHKWNIDTNITVADFTARKIYLTEHGVSKNWLDSPPNTQHQEIRNYRIYRRLIIYGLIVTSVLFGFILWFHSQKISR
jgi:hypothetical protein